MIEPNMREIPQPTPSARVREYGYGVNVSEPEGKALEALRLWTQAQADPALTARLDALSMLHNAVSLALDDEDGQEEFLEFTEDEPGLAALALNVAHFVKGKAERLLSSPGKRYKPII